MPRLPIFWGEAVALHGQAQGRIHGMLLCAYRRPKPQIVDELKKVIGGPIAQDRAQNLGQVGALGRIAALTGKVQRRSGFDFTIAALIFWLCLCVFRLALGNLSFRHRSWRGLRCGGAGCAAAAAAAAAAGDCRCLAAVGGLLLRGLRRCLCTFFAAGVLLTDVGFAHVGSGVQMGPDGALKADLL